MKQNAWLHDAYALRTAAGLMAVCDTCGVEAGPYASLGEATLAAARHIRSRPLQEPGPELPEPAKAPTP